MQIMGRCAKRKETGQIENHNFTICLLFITLYPQRDNSSGEDASKSNQIPSHILTATTDATFINRKFTHSPKSPRTKTSYRKASHRDLAKVSPWKLKSLQSFWGQMENQRGKAYLDWKIAIERCWGIWWQISRFYPLSSYCLSLKILRWTWGMFGLMPIPIEIYQTCALRKC